MCWWKEQLGFEERAREREKGEREGGAPRRTARDAVGVRRTVLYHAQSQYAVTQAKERQRQHESVKPVTWWRGKENECERR